MFYSGKEGVSVLLQKIVPYANLIGWDVTLDECGTPIVIEINLDSAVIEAHQVFNGPILGDRLEEVKFYVDRKRHFVRYHIIPL